MNATYKSPLELYVNSIVKESSRKSLPKVFVRKAIALINEKLNSACCNGDATIDLLTSRDNNLTLITKKLLQMMPKQGNVHSLERTKKILNKFIGLCCGANHVVTTVSGTTVNYTFDTNYVDEVTSYTVSLFDASTNIKFGSTQTLSSNINVDTLSGSFSSVTSGTYYINLVTNYADGRAKLFTSHNITV